MCVFQTNQAGARIMNIYPSDLGLNLIRVQFTLMAGQGSELNSGYYRCCTNLMLDNMAIVT